MSRRPISEQVRQWLNGELEVWRTGGILNEAQSDQILNFYETSGEAMSRRRSVAMFALSGIAALLVGLAALLVVSYNWQAMAPVAKLATIFGSLLALHGIGLALKRLQHALTSEVFFFVAGILYGAAIWLIAQIFHIQSHYPDGFWYWALGVLPFALCLETVLLHTLYAALLAIWVGTEVFGFAGMQPWWFGGFFFPRIAWTLPLLVLPGLLWAYRKRSVLAVGIYAPLLAWWAVLQPVAWQWRIDPVYFVGMAGVLFLLAAEMHREGSRMARPYRIYGVLLVGGTLVPLSFVRFIHHLVNYSPAANNFVAGLGIALVGAVAALAVVMLQQREARLNHGSWIELLRRQWLPLALLLLLVGLCFWCGLFTHYSEKGGAISYYDSYTDSAKWTPPIFVPMIATNMAMIVLSLWLMRVGLREDRTTPFAVGVLYFLFWAVLRYIDLFAGVGGMLGAALMFLLCGVGLFAVARFWLHRKENDHV